MSGLEDNENSPPDSQETYYDKSQNINDSQVLNESQDFALVVADDSEESINNQSEPTDQDIGNDNFEENLVDKHCRASDEIEKETQNLTSQDDEKEKDKSPVRVLRTDVDSVKEQPKEKAGSDDDEIIQATPPEISSPSRKLLSGMTPGKRRADSIDEPVAKIQRTLSQRDALKFEKLNLATETTKTYTDNKLITSDVSIEDKESQDILCDNTQQLVGEETPEIVIKSHPQNMVIEETQDLEDSEPCAFASTPAGGIEDTNDKCYKSVEKNDISLDQYGSQFDVVSSNKVNSDSTSSPLSNIDRELGEHNKANLSNASDKIEKAVTNGSSEENAIENTETERSLDVEKEDFIKNKIHDFEDSTEGKENSVPKVHVETLNIPLPTSNIISSSNFESGSGSNSSNKSRQSVELIYDAKSKSQENKKPVDLVEIDEEGEKIVLDSSNEGYELRLSTGSSTEDCDKSNKKSSYKSTGWHEVCEHNETVESSDTQLINGDDIVRSSSTKKSINVNSDLLSDDIIQLKQTEVSKSATTETDEDRYILSSKFNDTMEYPHVVSDSDGDSLVIHEGTCINKSLSKISASNVPTPIQTMAVEKNTRFYVDLKYLLHIDDNTKEIVGREVTDVHCTPVIQPQAPLRNNDTSGSLADISGNANKDSSPGSVISNPQLYQLPTSRFSMASTVSSSSTASSAASLAMKSLKNTHFSLPKGRAKQTKRLAIETTLEEKLDFSESFDKVTQGWKNAHLITDALLESANMMITSPELFQYHNEPCKTDDKILSSTPEPVVADKVISQSATPQSTKDKKPLKRTRTKSASTTRSNGVRKASPEVITTSQEDMLPINKKKRDSIDSIQSDKSYRQVSTPNRISKRAESLRSLTPQNIPNDELVGKVVFAKWSDNNYYPGEVTERTKDKARVKFYDGKSKLLIEEFIIPVPDLLRNGLSVYATTKDDDYGSTGMIMKSEIIKGIVYYTVGLEKEKKVKVQTKDIFLTPDQSRILKQEMEVNQQNIPKTPQHLGQVSLDNLVDGKRRSRRAATPTISTPKTRKNTSPKTSKVSDNVTPSGSGVRKIKGQMKEISSSESDIKTSDSNVTSTEDVDGVQPELLGVPVTQISKGPASRMKSSARNKSKQTQEDVELGPIPPSSSHIFKNMSFILTSTSLDIISRHYTDDSCSETGTENEEEWSRTPYLKDRVKTQLTNGGGTVYDSFKLLPQAEYKNTKLITNVPNLTAKSIQCLSVGIKTYSHIWVIQCCRENKALNPTAYELPAGRSIGKRKYIESYDRPNKQPFNGMIIGMPTMNTRNITSRSIQFWRRICENVGAGVQIIDSQGTDFRHATVILTDNSCPSWIIEKADNWQIPLVSTTWIVQCVIEGQLLIHDSHPQYKHSAIQS